MTLKRALNSSTSPLGNQITLSELQLHSSVVANDINLTLQRTLQAAQPPSSLLRPQRLPLLPRQLPAFASSASAWPNKAAVVSSLRGMNANLGQNNKEGMLMNNEGKFD